MPLFRNARSGSLQSGSVRQEARLAAGTTEKFESFVRCVPANYDAGAASLPGAPSGWFCSALRLNSIRCSAALETR
jgi:hypothetical protein